MPVWVAEFLGALVRWAITVAATALVARNIIPQDVADSVVAHGVPAILGVLMLFLPLFWSWVQKWRQRKLRQLALEMKPGTSEKELDAAARNAAGKGIGTGAMLWVVAIALSALTVAASGCRSFSLPDRSGDVSSVEQAAKCVAILGETYETSMEILVELRRSGKVSDEQWSEIDKAQKAVNLYGPQLADAVDEWRKLGSRRSFDATYEQMKGAVDTVARMQSEVK